MIILTEIDYLDSIKDEDLNPEKKNAIKHNDSTIVVANPGTGKTKLLAYKYVYLLHQGIEPKDILCLTFTEKACQEMQERILKLITKEKLSVDLTKVNIQTFHAFALDNLEDSDIVSSNLLRYEIYSYLIENQVLSYGDSYLLEKIVPKIENSIRYLKSYGITPDQITIDDVKPFVNDFKKYLKQELEVYLEHFIKIFERYEEYKKKKGLDYTDLLINFTKQNIKPKFKWVLVDELQDVNNMEADIALSVCEKYLVVGDKKQAIFGFQGGSISNFKKFSSAKEFILSSNFRSTDEILDYAKQLFSTRTADSTNIEEIKNLKSEDGLKGKKPIILLTKNNKPSAVCNTIKDLQKEDKEIAVIARTNGKLLDLAKELDLNGISYSSTYLTSSEEAKDNIIAFLKGLLSKDINLIKASMFTPFFPICMQDAFELAEDYNLTLENIYSKCLCYKELRESITNVNDLDNLFRNIILPVAISYGRDYTLSCINMQRATLEALELLEDKTLENLSNFLESAEQLAEDVGKDKKVILTTVHKAKGREFDIAIYVPSKPNDTENFQDAVTTAILNSKEINPKEELEEEPTRIDFVAVTRAKKQLYIVTDKATEYYLPDQSELLEYNAPESSKLEFSDINKKAFSLFVNKDYENAKKQLENKDSWLLTYITKHFENLNHLSFSGIQTDPKLYLEQRILKLKQVNKSLTKGSNIHSLIEQILNNKPLDLSTLDKETQEILDNVKSLISQIKTTYPEVIATELKFDGIPLNTITTIKSDLTIKGFIDAIFRNPTTGQYLIVDWKTDRDPKAYAADHRQQLEVYKNIYSYQNNIPIDKLQVAIGYVSTRQTINDGTIGKTLDLSQPAKTALGTITKHIQTIVDWKTNPETFLQALEDKAQSPTLQTQSPIVRALIQQYHKEQEKV